MDTSSPYGCKSNKSSEKFEVNGAFLKISEQIKAEFAGKTLDEVIQYLVSRVRGRYLFSHRLKTVFLSVGMLNRAIDNGEGEKMVKMAEALQSRGIQLIGDAVAQRPKVKAILIAGPSSSGKTTFSKKLCMALERNGYVAKSISFDDYYVDREKTPLDAKGGYDYESIYALDIPLFQKHFNQLLQGEEVELPHYDFTTGKNEPSGRHLRLEPNTVLIMEGIHALNPMLTGEIPSEALLRVYISGLTVAKQDNGTYQGTTDNRLLRRMVRDAQFRNTTASETLARWPSVRRGEDHWIVPFQENADINFCTGFQYEIALLKEKALPLLKEVPQTDPNYGEAQRLIWVCNRFHDLPVSLLPPDSLLREFLGDSAFEY